MITQRLYKHTENKVIRNSTRDVFTKPCFSNNDKVTIFTGDVTQKNNYFILNSEKRELLESSLKKIESGVPTEEYEQELIGQIKKIDGVKNEEITDCRLTFIVEERTTPIDVTFENKLSDEEIRNLLFRRIRIDGKVTVRGSEILNIKIKSYKMSPKKKLKDYSTKND